MNNNFEQVLLEENITLLDEKELKGISGGGEGWDAVWGMWCYLFSYPEAKPTNLNVVSNPYRY